MKICEAHVDLRHVTSMSVFTSPLCFLSDNTSIKVVFPAPLLPISAVNFIEERIVSGFNYCDGTYICATSRQKQTFPFSK